MNSLNVLLEYQCEWMVLQDLRQYSILRCVTPVCLVTWCWTVWVYETLHLSDWFSYTAVELIAEFDNQCYTRDLNAHLKTEVVQ